MISNLLLKTVLLLAILRISFTGRITIWNKVMIHCTAVATMAAVVVGDLRRFDPLSAVWTSVSGQIAGPPPCARYLPGLAPMGGKLYLFGGADAAGGKSWRM